MVSNAERPRFDKRQDDIMARTPAARIIEWGTPPEPEPTGWDAIARELENRIGEWANVGTFSIQAARRIGKERLTEAAGFQTRVLPTKENEQRAAVWARYGTEPAPRTADAAPEPAAAPKPRTVKRGSVV